MAADSDDRGRCEMRLNGAICRVEIDRWRERRDSGEIEERQSRDIRWMEIQRDKGEIEERQGGDTWMERKKGEFMNVRQLDGDRAKIEERKRRDRGEIEERQRRDRVEIDGRRQMERLRVGIQIQRRDGVEIDGLRERRDK